MPRIADRGSNMPFLRLPPFPRAQPRVGAGLARSPVTPAQAASLANELLRLRVGGTFWLGRPAMPEGCSVALVPSSRAMAQEMADLLRSAAPDVHAVAVAPEAWFARAHLPCRSPVLDPWHLAAQFGTLWTGGDDERALIAALSGKRVRTFGPGRFTALDATAGPPPREAVIAVLAAELSRTPIANPFTGAPWSPAEAIAQLGAWRAMIDANRVPTAIYGVARWKRVTMDALLWDGTGPVRYGTSSRDAGDSVLAWVARVRPATIDALAARGIRIGEIEDGMIRSQGLGANCVPPLSVIVDSAGAHFDPSRPNGLETLLAEADFPPDVLARAAALRARLVAAGLSKYGSAAPVQRGPEPSRTGRRCVLVPGQVEDDRSVMLGGNGLTNLALLARARAAEPDADITYRPHPDVVAGHRKGHVPEADARAFADRIEPRGAITAAIDAADALHVITSLAGFEALMRGKAVTTHGVPFYAGWGLTCDRGLVPPRRGRVRSIDELVAAVLIVYPRYLDPVTRLPCPVERLVERLAAGDADISSPLIVLRTWQGRLNHMLSGLKSALR